MSSGDRYAPASRLGHAAEANSYRMLWAADVPHTTSALPSVVDAAASARALLCLELETHPVLADHPSNVERSSPDAGEPSGRGIVLALFIGVVFLAGVFLGASLTGPPTSKMDSVPAKHVAAAPLAARHDAIPAAGAKVPTAPAETRGPSFTPVVTTLSPSSPAAPTAVQPASPLLPAAATSQQTPSSPSLPSLPPAGSAAAPLTEAQVEELLARGETMLGSGHPADARPLLERAAVAGDGTAALRLGQTYDPAFLARGRLQSVRADPGLAVFWYRRGQELGNDEAAYLLRQSEVAARARWNGK